MQSRAYGNETSDTVDGLIDALSLTDTLLMIDALLQAHPLPYAFALLIIDRDYQ